MTTMYGGTASQGHVLGVLMNDTRLPRIPGDSGNAFTYDFPVTYYTVKGASAARVIESTDYSLTERFIEGAQWLEAQGCKCIASSCGFVIAFQKVLAESVNIPVISSGLLQVPMVMRMLKPDQIVGILTANGNTLDPKHFLVDGTPEDRIAIQGMQEFPKFYKAFPGNSISYNYEECEADMIAAAQKLIREHPNVGAIVCEGTNMATFNPAVNRATGVPVFDIITLIRHTVSGILRGMTCNFGQRLEYRTY